MRKRDEELAKGWVQIVPTLSEDTPGDKQKMDWQNLINNASFMKKGRCNH